MKLQTVLLLLALIGLVRVEKFTLEEQCTDEPDQYNDELYNQDEPADAILIILNRDTNSLSEDEKHNYSFCDCIFMAEVTEDDDLGITAATQILIDQFMQGCPQNPQVLGQPLKFESCDNGNGQKLQDWTTCFRQFDIQNCYSYMGTLDASTEAFGDIKSNCSDDLVDVTFSGKTQSQGAIELIFHYDTWSPFKVAGEFTPSSPPAGQDPFNFETCKFVRKMYSSSNCQFDGTSNDPTCNGGPQKDPSQWGTEITWTYDKTFTDMTGLSPFVMYFDKTVSKGRMYLPITDIVNPSSSYCREMKDGNGEVFTTPTSYYYQCYFTEDIRIWGVSQLVYSFHVQLQVNRETQASEFFQSTPTLDKGTCCQNSLNIDSHLWFCDKDKNGKDGGACTKPNTLEEIARLEDFYIRWELNENSVTYPETANIKPEVSLYPDTVTIGPFIPDWTINESWEGVTEPGVSLIKVKSNVAFVAFIEVIGRIYDYDVNTPGPGTSDNNTRPHSCFPVNGVYQGSCTSLRRRQLKAENNARRALQTDEQKKLMGGDESQVSVKSAIQIIEVEQDNQTNKKVTKKGKDDNTTLIVAVVALIAVIIFGGIVGGLYVYKTNQLKKSSAYRDNTPQVKQVQ